MSRRKDPAKRKSHQVACAILAGANIEDVKRRFNISERTIEGYVFSYLRWERGGTYKALGLYSYQNEKIPYTND